MILVKYRYQNICHNIDDIKNPGYKDESEEYWSLIDQTGQIHVLPFEISDNSELVFFDNLIPTTTLAIFMDEDKFKHIELNRRGELVKRI